MYKPIKSKISIKGNKITVLNEYGYKEVYEIIYNTFIDPSLYDPDNCKMCKKGIPEIQTTFKFRLIDQSKLKTSSSRNKIIKDLETKNIIPESLEYDRIFLGFVYSNEQDQNNHKWWLDFRDINNNSVYNYYGQDIELNCPITTTSWNDGGWHGRYVIDKNQVDKILDNGKIIINGKLSHNKKVDLSNLPKETKSLRIRYNIRENIWLCDVLDNKGNELEVIPCKSIICDVKMSGVIYESGDKPKVSIKIKIKDVSSLTTMLNNLIIKGV